MVDQENPSTQGWGWVIGVTIVLILVVALPAGALQELGPCGGDGGLAFAAPGSPRGKVCESGILPPLLLLVAPGSVLMLGLMAIRREDKRLLQAGVVTGVVLLLVGVALPFALSEECAGEGDPNDPYDCY